MKNRFLSVIIALSMIITCVASTAVAANAFPDVLSPDHDWAAEQIEEMTNLGIIKGYTDGTFKPDKSVSKIEALLLFSRVAGYSNAEYAKIADFAYEKYQYMLEELDLGVYDSFKRELAFLLYKGIMDEDKIGEYLEDEQYSDEFPRSDAAILLANLMDEEIPDANKAKLEFDDVDEIPDDAVDYIAYVVENGFMNGVEKDDGSIVFDAKAPLSRAQVCVLLYRIMNKLDMSVMAGVVDKVDTDGGVIDFESSTGSDESYIVSDDVKIIIDGVKAELADILEESNIVVVRHGKSIYSIEVVNPASNKTVKGQVEAIVSRSNFVKLSVAVEGTEEVVTYYANEEFDVTTDGVADDFDSVKLGDYVVVKLLGTDIVSVDRQTSEATVQGVVEKISLSTPITLSVLTVDEVSKKETVAEYTVSENATIRRDGEKASLRDIFVGDKVVLTITRGDISKIIATSSKGNVTGSVTALKIAAQSSVTISTGGVEKEYPIAIDASFVVGGAAASIYDLRLGNVVTLTLSGSTATKVEQNSSSSVTTKSGTVDTVSTSYGYINMIAAGTTGSISEQIFVSKLGTTINAKIINGETGKELALKDIKNGDYIIATGAYNNGAFVAKTIVVTPMAK